jgi:branched-chain amino acid transport system permease protein
MDAALSAGISIVFNGLAYAMVLYLISVGLSVTMGLMGFANLAHGVFAMVGGYVTVKLMDLYGVPFVLALLAAFIVVALFSMILERTLYARLYSAGELEQVLFSGYRTFLIVVGFGLVLSLWATIERTNFGAQVRAAVDNRRMAESLGINTARLFTLTFALGSGLAALGGGLGADLLAINPGYALEYLVYFLIVVSVGGLGTIRGPFVAAVLLGVGDYTFKYLAPDLGAFFIFAAMIGVLLWRPAGLFGRA